MKILIDVGTNKFFKDLNFCFCIDTDVIFEDKNSKERYDAMIENIAVYATRNYPEVYKKGWKPKLDLYEKTYTQRKKNLPKIVEPKSIDGAYSVACSYIRDFVKYKQFGKFDFTK